MQQLLTTFDGTKKMSTEMSVYLYPPSYTQKYLHKNWNQISVPNACFEVANLHAILGLSRSTKSQVQKLLEIFHFYVLVLLFGTNYGLDSAPRSRTAIFMHSPT